MLSSQQVFTKDLLSGKTFLVTGGGSGLGKEMTRTFATHGADVIICGRRGEVLNQTADEINALAETTGRVFPKVLDIRSAQDVEHFVDEIFVNGKIDGLINNAAGNFISRTKDLSSRGFDAIANIVFHGTFYLTLAVGKKWIERGMEGHIIAILTTWVWTGSPFTVPSAMSKAAINTMIKSLAVEWGPHNIRANAIAPGPFPTEGAWARLRPEIDEKENNLEDDQKNLLSANPMGRVGDMSELQNLALFLMSDASKYINGQTIAIDGGQYLKNNGGFNDLEKLTDEDWKKIKETIKSTNAADQAKRNA